MKKVNEWIQLVEKLSEVGKSNPHAADCAYIGSMRIQLSTHLSIQMEIYSENRFLSQITGQDEVTDIIRQISALPTSYGGLGIVVPSSLCETEWKSTNIMCTPSEGE
ncbi:hypothetical protein GJ496_006425 [Pomphorhynchus laevis]|nr:hypothetical protein GJ496_006425 [Pomphorhynchus laevis]